MNFKCFDVFVEMNALLSNLMQFSLLNLIADATADEEGEFDDEDVEG